MKYRTILLTGLMFPSLCLASSPAPFNVEQAVLDRIATTAKSQPSASRIALETLERVVEGRAESISVVAESQLGLKPGELRRVEFKDATVRAYAVRKIGESNLSDALQYLRNLRQDHLPPDESQQVWPATQIALHEALLNRVPNSQSRIEFLENALTTEHDAISNSAVATWAANELCDGGALSSLPVIQQSIRKRDPFPSGEEEMQFCEARIRVVTREPDRLKALSSVLRVDSGTQQQKLMFWAINQLASMHSNEADAELDRFADEIRRLPEGSPQKQQLFALSQSIHELHAQRSQ